MAIRLLIVDDDASLTTIVAMTANTLGIDTMQVNDPMRALDAFVSYRPDLTVLDIFMPEKDGLDLLNEILLTGIHTRIVLTSGSGEELLPLAHDLLRFHGAADAITLPKPFRRAELVEALTRATV